jgi:hypothetical protein
MDDPLAILEKCRTFERQRQTAGGAHKQFHAEPLFQRVKSPAHHRGRNAFDLRRCGQAPLRDDRHESFDLLEAVHVRAFV